MKVHLSIGGRVQGVFYRASTRERALSLGLRGFVRNRRDGTVELCAEGPDEAVEALQRWCAEGPPSARVDRVDPLPPSEEALPAAGFEIRGTR